MKNRIQKKHHDRLNQKFGMIDNLGKYKCPVYLCKKRYQNEESLYNHYKVAHKDLFDLGLKLRMSKKLREEIKRKKEEEKANQILLDGGATKNKNKNKKQVDNKKNEVSLPK